MGNDRIDVPGDDGVPNIARIYDYLLGGSQNFAADRTRAEQIMAVRPSVVAQARANRNFLRYAVERALDAGVRQFLDLGSGIPTVGNVHEIAHRRDSTVRVAYVDHEAVAVAHSRSVLDGIEHVTMTDADLRDVETVLAAPGVVDLLDFARPVALLLVASLHFVSDEEDPEGILTRYREALPEGSVLALSHGSGEYPDDPEFTEANRELARLVSSTSHPLRLRTPARIEQIVRAAGFVPDPDGVEDLARWSSPRRDPPLGSYAVTSEPLR